MKTFVLSLLLILVPCSLYSQPGIQNIERQKAINWCWAACVQSLVNQANRGYYTQDQIASALSGWPADRPAFVYEVANLCRFYGLRAWQAGYAGSPNDLYGSLSNGWKLIAFVMPNGGPVGHYIILQGIDYRSGLIIVSDPATGQTNLIDLNHLYLSWRWIDSVVVGT